MSTNKIRYDWQRVSPEVLQELAQSCNDYVVALQDCNADHGPQLQACEMALQKARWQAVVMEIDSPKIDVLAAAEAYYKAKTDTYIIGKECSTLEKLLAAMRKAFGPKS